jgi:hypothetical protein
LLDYRRDLGIRFTLPFGKAITIAATYPGMKPRVGGIGRLAIFGKSKRRAPMPRLRNEGVGEHVRTKSQPAKSAAETADLWIRTDEENFFLLPSRFSPERTLLKITVRPFDLMSRRHPLSSTRAAGLEVASRSKPSWRLL